MLLQNGEGGGGEVLFIVERICFSYRSTTSDSINKVKHATTTTTCASSCASRGGNAHGLVCKQESRCVA